LIKKSWRCCFPGRKWLSHFIFTVLFSCSMPTISQQEIKKSWRKSFYSKRSVIVVEFYDIEKAINQHCNVYKSKWSEREREREENNSRWSRIFSHFSHCQIRKNMKNPSTSKVSFWTKKCQETFIFTFNVQFIYLLLLYETWENNLNTHS
jgi:hypothetical protein